ncbi:MAG: LysR substrate-binding domain-containing protein [Pirellulales bacterium]|nr:LysR substrate-binding domain-containing protein [Pirellulales bacterium]
MELRHLRYFLAVAQHAHFRIAAEQLLVSQPTLSQQIKDLERELGTPLFERVGRRVRLTDAGRTFQHYAARTMTLLSEAQQSLDLQNDVVRGKLRVGVVQTVNAYLIPPVAAAFLSRYPEVSLQIFELSADEIEQQVYEGQLDLGVSFLPRHAERFDLETLFQEDLVLVPPKGHDISKRKRISFNKLAEHRLALLGPQFCTRRIIDASFAKAGRDPQVAVEMNSVEGLMALVAAGGPATIVPELASHNGKLNVVRLEAPRPTRSVCLLRVKGYAPVATRLRFAEELRNAVNRKT